MTDAGAPAMPAVGDPAPDFALPDDTGATRRLADARGRWLVLFFYPKDDTPGCTVEACEFRDAYADLRHHSAEIWGISKLDSESKARFKEKFSLGYPLLADEDHAVSQAYGTWVEKKQYGKTTMGVKRATFLVDPDGRIAHVWPSVTAEGHAAQVHEELERAQAATAAP